MSLWHGWLPGLSLYGETDRWVLHLGSWLVGSHAFPADNSSFWLPKFCDADDLALEMTDAPNIWTDDCPVGGFEVAGAGVYLPAPDLAMESAVWGVAEEYGDARLERCRAFMPAPVSVLSFGVPLIAGVLALSFGL